MLLSLFFACSSQVLDTHTRTLPAEALTGLRFDISAGDAIFIAEEGADAITAEATVGAIVGPGHEPCDVMAAFTFVLDERGDEAVLEVGFEGAEHMGAWADLVVTGPPHLILTGEDSSGDLEIVDFAGLTLTEGSGDTSVFNISGDVDIEDDSGDLWIDGVGGDLMVIDGSGDLNIYAVAGDVFIEDDSGDIRVDGVGGAVSVIDGSGDIRVSNAGSTDIIEDGSGDIRLD
ncbi:MAG: hypothetical protein ACI8RZ_000097 [Myxococcota bacterium]|jgi:hypothetical protein